MFYATASEHLNRLSSRAMLREEDRQIVTVQAQDVICVSELWRTLTDLECGDSSPPCQAKFISPFSGAAVSNVILLQLLRANELAPPRRRWIAAPRIVGL